MQALAEKEGVVREAAVRGDIDTALTAFSQVITAYREARMDWSYTHLAKASGLPCTIPIYALAKAIDKTSRNRIGGRVKGLAADRMPPGMQLVLTIDLAQVPELGALVPGARALSLWVDDPRGGFEDAAVVPLTEDECASGMVGGKTFRVERLLVPPEVFDWSDGRTQELRRWLAALDARGLGRPFFLQQSPFSGDDAGFVLQANESFTGLNLGDSGRLFWYLDHAYWESA